MKFRSILSNTKFYFSFVLNYLLTNLVNKNVGAANLCNCSKF
jgi:hypothetical protein